MQSLCHTDIIWWGFIFSAEPTVERLGERQPPVFVAFGVPLYVWHDLVMHCNEVSEIQNTLVLDICDISHDLLGFCWFKRFRK